VVIDEAGLLAMIGDAAGRQAGWAAGRRWLAWGNRRRDRYV